MAKKGGKNGKSSHIINCSYRKITEKKEEGGEKRNMHFVEQIEATESELHRKKYVMIF